MLTTFFQTELGQKLLLFLAPFFLSPHEFKGGVSDRSAITKQLYLSAFAPLLGAAFVTGAVVAVFRTLINKGISIAWILDYHSAYLIFTQAALLTWLGYSAALSRFVSGEILGRFKPALKAHIQWPLAFWLSYYGGILIVAGVFAWMIVGALSLHFSYIAGAIILGIVIVLGFYLRLEIKLAQDKNRRRIHYSDWGVYNKLSLGLFMTLQLVCGAVVLYLQSPGPELAP